MKFFRLQTPQVLPFMALAVSGSWLESLVVAGYNPEAYTLYRLMMPLPDYWWLVAVSTTTLLVVAVLGFSGRRALAFWIWQHPGFILPALCPPNTLNVIRIAGFFYLALRMTGSIIIVADSEAGDWLLIAWPEFRVFGITREWTPEWTSRLFWLLAMVLLKHNFQAARREWYPALVITAITGDPVPLFLLRPRGRSFRLKAAWAWSSLIPVLLFGAGYFMRSACVADVRPGLIPRWWSVADCKVAQFIDLRVVPDNVRMVQENPEIPFPVAGRRFLDLESKKNLNFADQLQSYPEVTVRLRRDTLPSEEHPANRLSLLIRARKGKVTILETTPGYSGFRVE